MPALHTGQCALHLRPISFTPSCHKVILTSAVPRSVAVGGSSSTLCATAACRTSPCSKWPPLVVVAAAMRRLLQARCSACSGACSGEHGLAMYGIEGCLVLVAPGDRHAGCVWPPRRYSCGFPRTRASYSPNLSGAWSVRRHLGLQGCYV